MPYIMQISTQDGTQTAWLCIPRGNAHRPSRLQPLARSVPAAAGQMLTEAPGPQDRMDYVEAALRLQDRTAAEQGYRWGKREGQAEVKKLRCLVIFCFVLELALAFPVLYLLHKNARCAQLQQDEVPNEKHAEFQQPPALLSYSSRSGPEIKPRVHLTSSRKQTNEECVKDRLPSLRWRNDRSDEINQINYNSSYLIAPMDGDYFVYAQVTFLCPDGICETLKYCNKSGVSETQVQQVITKISPGYSGSPKPILKASSSIGEKNKWKKTLYLGGIIPLREGDRIMVNVSNLELVDIRTPEITFFGAFLI